MVRGKFSAQWTAVIAAAVTAAATAAIAQPAQSPPPAIEALVSTGAPLTALSVTPGSLNCAQGTIVVGADGRLGVLAPVIGPSVLRGSADRGLSLRWTVVSLDQVNPEPANAFTTCTTAQ